MRIAYFNYDLVDRIWVFPAREVRKGHQLQGTESFNESSSNCINLEP